MCSKVSASKVMRLFELLNVPCIKGRELCNIQSAYVIPAVYRVGKKNQESVKTFTWKGGSGSDMRVDSPGHSGLLGSGSTHWMWTGILFSTHK